MGNGRICIRSQLFGFAFGRAFTSRTYRQEFAKVRIGTTSTLNRNFGQNTMAQTTITIGDSNINCGNIISSFNHTFYKSDEDAKIMRWLSPLEPNNRHQSVRSDRFCGVED